MTDLRELAERVEALVGGAYELPDGRTFWIDHLAAKEITARALRAIASEQEKGAKP